MTGLRTQVASAFLAIATSIGASAQPDARLRVESLPIPGGAEFDTLLAKLPDGGDLPMVSILVDTLGDADPSNDVLKNVWVLTYARPTLMQRIVAGLPFMYLRAGSHHRRENAVPSSILDMSSVGHNTWLKLIRAIAQSEFLDPIGMPVRASSRAYASNTLDFRNEHVWQALDVLSAAQEQGTGALSHDELEQVQARLLLSTRFFGDLVSESYLPIVYDEDREARIQARQHNWELLRQKAEENGLYFQSLTLGFSKDANVLLWAERPTPGRSAHVAFNSNLLGIDDPFEGNWLEKWKGYMETWTLDENGSRVDPATAGSRTAVMVPVALYSLDYPTAPLLLIDFRQPLKAKRREMIRRATDQVVTGVLGITTFGNLEYFAAKTTWTIIRRRHGAAVDRAPRLRAYSQLRHGLNLDASLDPKLRRELLRRAEGLGLNPFEDGVETEAQLARDQYAALRVYAAAPNGLAKKLDAGRSREIARRVHTAPALAFLRLTSIATLGIYKHKETMTPMLLASLDRQRRFAWNRRFLEDVVDSSPRPEIAHNIEQVRHSLDAITEIGQNSGEFREASEDLVRRVLALTSDDATRRLCVDCLARLAVPSRDRLPVPSRDREGAVVKSKTPMITGSAQ
jgi:hypothetical protein